MLSFFFVDGKCKKIVFDNEFVLSLSNILQFITGASEIPAEGFDVQPSIVFHHDQPQNLNGRFPSANTCSCTLTIPVWEGLLNEERFCEIMTDAIIGCQEFGHV